MHLLFYCCCLLGIIFIIGDSTNSLIFKEKFKRPLALRLSLAYGLGTGTLGLMLFYLCYAGLKPTMSTIFFIFLPCAGFFMYQCIRRFRNRRQNFQSAKPFKKNGIIEYVLFLAIALSLTIITARALLLPMHLPDDRAQWGIKAKMLYYEKTVVLEALFDPERLQLHLAYPFLTPLLEAGFFSIMGEMNDRLVKLPFAVYFMCLLLFFYAAQKDFAPHRHALLFTGMLAVLPSFIQNVLGNPSSGYADVPLAFYYFIAVVGLINWLNRAQWQDLALATIFITFAMFTKQEGLYLWAFMVAAGLVLLASDPAKRSRSRFMAFFPFIFAPLIALSPWFHFKSTFVLSRWEKDWSLAQFAPDYISANLHRVEPILGAFKENFFFAAHWNWLWIIFFCLLILYPKKSLKIPPVVILMLVLCNVFAVFSAVVLYPWFWWNNFIGDMHRVLLLNIPLVSFYVSFQTHQIFEKR
jgi:hypothetical protein